ncbi:MAG: hypothetical protein RSD95_09845 [Clostridia bacterium]
MSYQEERLTEIANAIRLKKQTTAPIQGTSLAQEILTIPSDLTISGLISLGYSGQGYLSIPAQPFAIKGVCGYTLSGAAYRHFFILFDQPNANCGQGAGDTQEARQWARDDDGSLRFIPGAADGTACFYAFGI